MRLIATAAVAFCTAVPVKAGSQTPSESDTLHIAAIETPMTVETPVAVGDSSILGMDTLSVVGEFDPFGDYDLWEEREVAFNPSPTRAVWMSALFPGLGQIYNRRWWKLPLVAGGFMGLGYGVSWNNKMLKDYQQAYRDIMDNDPATRSYMNFFPPTTTEDSLDKQWLTNLLKSRKDFYRRNRDLCIISMVGVYLLAMLDAYVDASLSHFDITPDLSMDVHPAVIPDARSRLPGFGLCWAISF